MLEVARRNEVDRVENSIPEYEQESRLAYFNLSSAVGPNPYGHTEPSVKATVARAEYVIDNGQDANGLVAARLEAFRKAESRLLAARAGRILLGQPFSKNEELSLHIGANEDDRVARRALHTIRTTMDDESATWSSGPVSDTEAIAKARDMVEDDQTAGWKRDVLERALIEHNRAVTHARVLRQAIAYGNAKGAGGDKHD